MPKSRRCAGLRVPTRLRRSSRRQTTCSLRSTLTANCRRRSPSIRQALLVRPVVQRLPLAIAEVDLRVLVLKALGVRVGPIYFALGAAIRVALLESGVVN